jgi:SAM-dependent methyltransferase
MARAQRPDYGLDAPGVVAGSAAGGLLALAAAPLLWRRLRPRSRLLALLVSGWADFWGMVSLAQAGLMVRSSRVGKLRERDRLLDGIPWRGDERVLDVGCGRGLLLVGAAHRVPAGRAVGLDLWRRQDQAGNDRAATVANARDEGVADRVELHDGDVRRLPFPDRSFDVVVSSLALHNIRTTAERTAAVGEIARVLAPGGHVALLDFRGTADYAADLMAAGLAGVRRSRTRFGMHPPVRVVTATRPRPPS